MISVDDYPLTPYPPVREVKPTFYQRLAVRKAGTGRLRSPSIGVVVKGVTTPPSEVVATLEGPGWVGANELCEWLGLVKHGKLKLEALYKYGKVHRGKAPLGRSVLLAPHYKRYYHFDRRAWVELLAENTERCLREGR